MTFWDFANNHEIVTLLLFWVLIVSVFRSWNRFMRSRNIKNAGWPPIHLDADGDFKEEAQ